jgi:hypothetical protein
MNHEIQLRDRPLSFRGSKAITWPANLKWSTETFKDTNPGEVFHFRLEWDGYCGVFRAAPEKPAKIPLEQKPKMWQDRSGMWNCQLHYVRGRGTTKRHAYLEWQARRVAE